MPPNDQATADLILKLQLEDAGVYFDTSKGKSRDPTDEDIAFRLQQEELEDTSHFLNDKRMARSIAAAVQADGQTIASSDLEEKIASKDQELARNWRGSLPPVAEETASQAESDPSFLDDETLEKLQIMHMPGPDS